MPLLTKAQASGLKVAIESLREVGADFATINIDEMTGLDFNEGKVRVWRYSLDQIEPVVEDFATANLFFAFYGA